MESPVTNNRQNLKLNLNKIQPHSARPLKNRQYFKTQKQQKSRSIQNLKKINISKLDLSDLSAKTKKELSEYQMLRLRSVTRKDKFQNKLQKLTNTSNIGITKQLFIYRNQIDHLRKQLSKKQEEIIQLKQGEKIVKIRQLQIQNKQLYRTLHQFKGNLQKMKQIFEIYENQNINVDVSKKSIVKQLRQDNIRLKGQISKVKYQFQALETKYTQSCKDYEHNQRKLKKILKEKQQIIIHSKRTINPLQTSQYIEVKKQLQLFKKKNIDLQQKIQTFRIENDKLHTEIGQMKQLINMKESEIELFQKNLNNLKIQKVEIETKLYQKIREIENYKKQMNLQKETSIIISKRKQKKKMIKIDEVAKIAKKIEYNLMRKKILHNKICTIFDQQNFQNPNYPTLYEIKLFLHNVFKLKLAEQEIFAKYLLQNNSPLDQENQQATLQTNNIQIIKSIFEKIIPKYTLIQRNEQMESFTSIKNIFESNPTLIQKIKKTVDKSNTQFIELIEFKNFLESYFVVIKDQYYTYMEIKSFELTGEVQKINIIKLSEFFSYNFDFNK